MTEGTIDRVVCKYGFTRKGAMDVPNMDTKCECVHCGAPRSKEDLLLLIKTIEKRASSLMSARNFGIMPNCDFIADVAWNLRTHTHIDENAVIPLTATERKAFVAAASEILSKEWNLPQYMLVGTRYKGITFLDDYGVAHPKSEGGGYLMLESYESIAEVAATGDEDAKVWLSLAGDKVFTPRTLDLFDVMFLSTLANLPKSKPSLFFLEAAAIYNSTREGFYPPWAIGTLRGRMYSTKAKKAPVMLGAYFMDMIWLEHKQAIGMFPSSFDQMEMLLFRRELLSRGYFSSILETKKIKDVMVKLCGENTVFDTVMSSETGAIQGVSKKKCKNFLDGEEEVLSAMSKWPQLMRFVKNESDTISLTKRLTGLMHLTSSSNFIWTDIPIVALKSQHSKVAEIFDAPKPKLMDEDGHVYEYHDPPADIFQMMRAMWIGCPCPRDLNTSFIRDLTSNSAGTIPASIEEDIQKLPRALQGLARSKIGLVAIFGQILNSRELIRDSLESEIRVLFREQILRRPRLVAGLDVAKQLAPHVGKRLSKYIFRIYKSFVSGKTNNSAYDARHQLHGTGHPNMLMGYSDVPSFDGSSQLKLQEYICSLYMGVAAQYDVLNSYKGYFAIPPEVRTVREFDIHGREVTRYKTQISSPRCVWREASKSTPFNKVRGNRAVQLSHGTLGSGRFDTTLQAGSVTGSVGECVKNRFQHLSPTTDASGDDFQLQVKSFDYEKDSEEIGAYVREQMAAAGFGTENNFSSVFSEFLQIGALCGQVLSYGHRLSPYTSERWDERHRMDMIGSTIGIYGEELGRCHFPDELVRRMHTFCYVAGHMRVSKLTGDKYARTTKAGKHVKIPQVALYIRHNVPFPAFAHDLPSSAYTYGGDAKYFEAFIQTFGLRTVEQATRDDAALITSIGDRLSQSVKADNNTINAEDINNAQKKMLRSGFFSRKIEQRLKKERANRIHLKRALAYALINVAVAPDKSTFDDDDLSMMERFAANVNSLLDQHRVNMSASASVKLNELGIEVPDRLLFHRQSFYKIVGVYASRLKNDVYWSRMDAHIDSEFKRFIKMPYGKLFKDKLELFDIAFNVEKEHDVLEGQVLNAMKHCAPAPYCMYSEDGRLCLARCGTSGTRDNSISVLDRAVDFDYLANNTAAWEKIVAQLSNLRTPGDGVQLVAKAVGLDENESQVLSDLVSSEVSSPGGLLHITSNKRARFWMSEDARAITNRVSNANEKLSGERVSVIRTGLALTLMLEGIAGSSTGHGFFDMYFPGPWLGIARRKTQSFRR